MTGKSFQDFMDELYYNPEMEFLYCGERYMLSGYVTKNQYTIEVTNIDTSSTLFKKTGTSRNECVSAFEKAPIVNKKTIYEVEKEIEVLFG